MISAMKRLTVIPPTPAPPKTPAISESERRRRQRRLSIGRRVIEERRHVPAPEDPLFADQRERTERRRQAPRRKRAERRSGVRLFDLTKLDLSDLDS